MMYRMEHHTLQLVIQHFYLSWAIAKVYVSVIIDSFPCSHTISFVCTFRVFWDIHNHFTECLFIDINWVLPFSSSSNVSSDSFSPFIFLLFVVSASSKIVSFRFPFLSLPGLWPLFFLGLFFLLSLHFFLCMVSFLSKVYDEPLGGASDLHGQLSWCHPKLFPSYNTWSATTIASMVIIFPWCVLQVIPRKLVTL